VVEVRQPPVSPVVEPSPIVTEAVPSETILVEVAEPVAMAPVAVDAENTPEIEIVVLPAATPEAVVAIDLDKTLAESGLVMVQTSAPAAIIQPEPPPKLGRPRKAKVVEAENDAPLQIVETQR
jgi:ribonuclease E